MTVDARHHAAAEVLANGGSYQQAADRAGVNKSTVWRWANDDLGSDVPKLIARIVTEREEAIKLRSIEAARAALTRLVELMDSESDSVALGAAKTLWNSYTLEKTTSKQAIAAATLQALQQLDDGEWS